MLNAVIVAHHQSI